MPRPPKYMTKEQKKAAMVPLLAAQAAAAKAKNDALKAEKAAIAAAAKAAKAVVKATDAWRAAADRTAKLDAVPIIVTPKVSKSVEKRVAAQAAPKAARKPRTPKAVTAPAPATVN